MTPAEVATRDTASELGLTTDEYEALMAQQDSEFDSDTLQTPILKIGQPLTKEVQAEQAEPGEFINTLIGEGIGDSIEFIVCYYQKGRFAANRDTNKAYVAFGDLIPEHWEELVGPAFVATRFDEHPDAEETYKERVNNKEIEWGKGPLISTTHNYTGFALVEVGGDVDAEMQPVRLALQRTNMPAVRKINSLRHTFLRNRPFWERTFNLSTEKKTFPKGTAYLLSPKLGRQTTAEERLAAVELAQMVRAGRVTDNQESDSAVDTPPSVAKPNDALEV